jgi:DNA-binding transcriptional regulator YiaG
MTTKAIEYEINENNCFIVTSHQLDRQGYPVITRGSRKQKLSRYIYSLKHGEILEGKVIMHTCDNPSCINIKHLQLGTQQDNIQDMHNKNRSRWSAHDKTSGTFIKELRKSKGISQTWLAKQSGVNRTHLWKIEEGLVSPTKETLTKIMNILEENK